MYHKNSLKNQIHTIEISGISSDGQGVGHLDDGFTVFVPNALPNETVSVLIISVKTNFCVGKLLKVVISSPGRIKPPCPAAYKCGGCNLLHCAYPYQLDLKQQIVRQALTRIGQFDNLPIDRIMGMSEPFRYRNKSNFPLGISGGMPVMGFYSRRSHSIVPITDCLAEPEINSRVIRYIIEYINESGINIYDEKSHSGLLRHVIMRVGFKSGEVMVCLVINGKSLPKASLLIQTLKSNMPGFATLALNINKARTNVILGAKTRTLYGPGVISDFIGDLRFQISPASFFQVNPIQTEVLYETVLKFAGLSGEEIIIDAFCGIGTISLFLARHSKHVYGVEIVPDAVADARHNAKINGITNVSFYNDSAESWLPGFCRRNNVAPDICVIDPPRKGCGVVLLQAIAELSVRKVIYVSCDMGTLARDARLLADKGYIVSNLQPVDMFPQTSNVEAVMLLQR